MSTENHEKANNFKNRRIFTTQKEWFGIPSKIVAAGAALCLGIGFGLWVWAGLGLGLVFFPVMYQIHRRDPQALKAWWRGMQRKHQGWRGGVLEPVYLSIMGSKTSEKGRKR